MLTAGNGVDTFYFGGSSGNDSITGFSFSGGDKVSLGSGTTYSAATSGSNAVVTLSTDATITFIGVSVGDISSDWFTIG